MDNTTDTTSDTPPKDPTVNTESNPPADKAAPPPAPAQAKPADKPVDKPPEKTAETPAPKPADKPIEKAPEPVKAPPPPPPPAPPPPPPPPSPPAPPPSPPAPPAPTPLSPAASIVSELLLQYKSFLSAPISTAIGDQNAAKTFANVVSRMLQSQTPEIFEVMWDFFVANKDGVLHEGRALPGVASLDPTTRFRAEIVYTLFRKAVNGVDVGDPTKVRTDLAQSRLKCVALILFLQAKAKTVANTK